MSAPASTVRARGTSTTRTSSADSSTTSASHGSFRAAMSSAIFSIRRALGTCQGSSSTTTWYWPRASGSTRQRARTRKAPRPVR